MTAAATTIEVPPLPSISMATVVAATDAVLFSSRVVVAAVAQSIEFPFSFDGDDGNGHGCFLPSADAPSAIGESLSSPSTAARVTESVAEVYG